MDTWDIWYIDPETGQMKFTCLVTEFILDAIRQGPQGRIVKIQIRGFEKLVTQGEGKNAYLRGSNSSS
jgi:hypothetical protein